MKHSILRRLGALFLALALALPMAAVPAWAADDDTETDSGAIPATSISFNNLDDRVQFNASDPRTMAVFVTVLPVDTTDELVWSEVSDPTIVSASPRGSTGQDLSLPSVRKAGEATITASLVDRTTGEPRLSADGTPLSATLTIVVSGFTFSDTSLTMVEGEARTLSVAGRFGEAQDAPTGYGEFTWESSDPSIVSVEEGSLSAWTKGTATITATKTISATREVYSASCVVTVTEDDGTYVTVPSTPAGTPVSLGTSDIISQLNAIATERAGTDGEYTPMEYITGLFVSPDQGIVHNTHRSEADTGAGVSMSERYTVSGSGPQSLSALSFVPNRSFTGEARIDYTGVVNGRSISGVFIVQVTAAADVSYTAIAGSPLAFQAADFNQICQSRTGRNLNYVTFTPPQASYGTLYYNYVSPTQTGQAVTAGTEYYRTRTPSLDQVSFVPASGCPATVLIAYRGVDSSGTAFTGTVTISVTQQSSETFSADINYSAQQNSSVAFLISDFNNASLRTIGEALSYVRFTLPPSSDGTLFYNYRGFGSYDSAVSAHTNYYYNGTPALSGVSFVPTTTTPSQVAIAYTGYGMRGTAFTGTVYISVEGYAQQTITYSVNSGGSVLFQASDFNKVCYAATNSDLSYIRFTSLPSYTQGVLYYNYSSSYGWNSRVYAGVNYYYYSGNYYGVSAANLIGSIAFVPGSSFTGSVRIPYTGYSVNGVTYEGEVLIQTAPLTPSAVTYTGTNANPIRISASSLLTAAGGTLNLSYITITSLPPATSGHLYSGYNGFGTGRQVSIGDRFNVSGSPSIDQLSFVPRGRFQGQATVGYTAVSVTGQQVSGEIAFNIISAYGSSYFYDMGNYAWAASSVDYLYQNGVVNGITATAFGPQQNILRCDFVLMLCRAFGFTGPGGYSFADVPVNAYYAQALATAKSLGITTGDGINFRPNERLTREDAMVMLHGALAAAGMNPGSGTNVSLSQFSDYLSVTGYARNAVAALVQLGAVTGDNGRLNPQSPITRAEVAVLLHFVMTM